MKALLNDLKKIALLLAGLCLFTAVLILSNANRKPGPQQYQGWDEQDWTDRAIEQQIADTIQKSRNP